MCSVHGFLLEVNIISTYIKASRLFITNFSAILVIFYCIFKTTIYSTF